MALIALFWTTALFHFPWPCFSLFCIHLSNQELALCALEMAKEARQSLRQSLMGISTEEMALRRQATFLEILQTEENYVKDLELVIEVCHLCQVILCFNAFGIAFKGRNQSQSPTNTLVPLLILFQLSLTILPLLLIPLHFISIFWNPFVNEIFSTSP